MKAPSLGPEPVHYRYDLAVDPVAGRMSGSGEVVVRNSAGSPLTEVYLRLWGNAPIMAAHGGVATLSNATVDGSTARYIQNGTVVKITLPHALANGQQARVGFELAAQVPDLAFRTGREADGSVYFNNLLPTLAVHDAEGWNLDPYVNQGEAFYSLSSDWDITATAPAAFQLVSSGVEQARPLPGGQQLVTISAPHVRDVSLVALTNAQSLEQQVGATRVRVWAGPEQASDAHSMLRGAAESLRWFERRYGDYDYPELDVIASSPKVGGMEYPNLVLSPGGSSPTAIASIVAHEVAHQFFYGIVGNNEWDDPWLDEAFTAFATDDFLGVMASGQQRRAAPGTSISSPMNHQPKYFQTVYGDGSKALAMLRVELGDECFFAGMKSYVSANRNGIATTAGFIDSMSTTAGHDLVPWFQQHGILRSEADANQHLDPNSEM